MTRERPGQDRLFEVEPRTTRITGTGRTLYALIPEDDPCYYFDLLCDCMDIWESGGLAPEPPLPEQPRVRRLEALR